MIETLIRYGANLNREGRNRSPMDMAILYHDAASGELLRRHGAEYGIREAAAFDNVDQVRDIIARNPDALRTTFKLIPLTQSPQGLSPLGMALEHGHRDMVLLLIAAGAPLDSVESHGSSLLHVAARGGNAELIKLLADRGLDVNALDEYGQTPSHIAAQFERLDAVSALAAAGADLNRETPNGYTPLRWAVEVRRNVELARLLLDSGANPMAKRRGTNKTLLDAAREMTGQQQLVELLEQAVARQRPTTADGPP